MKKIVILLTLSVLIISSFSCKKDDSGDDTEKTYSVVYKLEINENHSTSKISWIGLNNERIELTNPTYPWQMEYSGLKSGDSVAMNFEVVNLPNLELSFTWSAEVSGSGYNKKVGDTSKYLSNQIKTQSDGWNFKLP